MKNILTLLFVAALLASCSGKKMPVPKPPTYLRLNLPEHTYKKIDTDCPYSFELPEMFKVHSVTDQDGKLTCHKDIDMGALNGTIHLSYIKMNRPLSEYINFSIDKVDEHKVRATAIEDTNIIRSKAKVYGTFFELQGNVASPFQFYLTDSVSNFASGVIYFNSKPNYDSIRPSLEYLKKDLYHFFDTFEWK